MKSDKRIFPTRIARILVWSCLCITLSNLCFAASLDSEGFRYAEPGYQFSFPRDHGSHPEFKIEWWYLTGHLWNEDRSRRFGYQATFFRRGVSPESARKPATPSPFGSSQVYLAHMTLLDVQTKAFVYEERINRDGWDAGAERETLHVHNGNWSLRAAPSPDESDQMTLSGSVRADALFHLDLKASKPKVIFGKDGISRKGKDATAASHYITYPRLDTRGTLVFRGKSFQVQGQTWMDHEISSSQLDTGQVGWDWASVQLESGQEIMVYIMRREDGRIDPFSTLAWIDETGRVTHIGPDHFTWTKSDYWTSPHSKARYPIRSELQFKHPSNGTTIHLRLVPLALDQEIQGELGGIRYWEGACDVLDSNSNSIGSAYVELTGYDGKLRETLR